jgi:predicted secreted protein
VGFAAGNVVMGGSDWSSDDFTLTTNNTATIGTDGTCPWSSQVAGMGTSFTLSFDVNSIASNTGDWKTLVGLYSNGGATTFNHCMALTTNGAGNGTIILQSGLGGETAYGNAGSQTLETKLTVKDVDNTTFTIVSDAEAKLLTLYVDGQKTAEVTNWVAGNGESLALTGFQFGSCFSEAGTIGNAEVSNITVWNKALTSSEVAGLVVPEPTTATLSLLALAGLAMRRRRK